MRNILFKVAPHTVSSTNAAVSAAFTENQCDVIANVAGVGLGIITLWASPGVSIGVNLLGSKATDVIYDANLEQAPTLTEPPEPSVIESVGAALEDTWEQNDVQAVGAGASMVSYDQLRGQLNEIKGIKPGGSAVEPKGDEASEIALNEAA